MVIGSLTVWAADARIPEQTNASISTNRIPLILTFPGTGIPYSLLADGPTPTFDVKSPRRREIRADFNPVFLLDARPLIRKLPGLLQYTFALIGNKGKCVSLSSP